ncbi:MAG: hypothetical protein OXT65_04035 [Alphaproteobacteria bacterium]|nr:hypothetical protein [Alphaproteobacteria bacterium]
MDAAKAQAEPETAPVDRAFIGNWASPDCGHNYEALVITKYFLLHAEEERFKLVTAASTGQGEDYSTLRIEEEDSPAIRSEDSLLSIANMGGTPRKDWAQTWDELAMIGRHEYTGCPDIAPYIPVPLVFALKHIDAIKEVCTSMTAKCQSLLFSIADSNSDKKLSDSEFKTAGMVAGTLATLADGTYTTTEDVKSGYLHGRTVGEHLAQTLTGQDTSLTGLKKAWQPLKNEDMHTLQEKLAQIFSGLK